jgi:hypothetical protein
MPAKRTMATWPQSAASAKVGSWPKRKAEARSVRTEGASAARERSSNSAVDRSQASTQPAPY